MLQLRKCRQGDDGDETRITAFGLTLARPVLLSINVFAMNVFAMNLAAGRVDHGYRKVLIVAQAVVAKMLREFFAMIDRFGVGFEIDSDPVPKRHAIFHIEKEFLHLPHLKLL